MKDTDESWPVPSGPTLEQVKETIASLEATDATATPGLGTGRRRREPRRGRVAPVDSGTANDVLPDESEVPADLAVDTQPVSLAAVASSRVAWIVAATGLVLLLWGAKQVMKPAVTPRLAGGSIPVSGVTGRQRLEPPRVATDASAPRSEPSAPAAERQTSLPVAPREQRESAPPVKTLSATVEPIRPREVLESPSIPVNPSVPALPAPRSPEPIVVATAPVGNTTQEALLNSSSSVATPAVVSTALPAPPSLATTVLDSRAEAVAAANVTQPENNVRAVLEGYRTAYNELNAAQAKALWPSVDVRTLSKAFDQLQSQEIRFTNCEIALATDSAHAVCAGFAAFVPKVGSRERRSTAREWKFALRHSTDGWVIAGVDMR